MQSLASLAVLAAVAFGVAIVYVRISMRLARLHLVEIGATLKLRGSSGVYRSRLLSRGRREWEISAPLQRDAYVPLRVGEDLVLEAPCADGILLFRSHVLDRNQATHTISIAPAATVSRVDRRELKRWPHLAGEIVRVEGESGTLIDVSEGGARLETHAPIRRGDRVRIDMPWGDELYGWVLAAEGVVARIRFEDLMRLPCS